MVHRYERLRHISTGRFGSALLVRVSGRLAMMKTIDVGRLDNAERGEVLAEVVANASLRHPHLVSVQECFLEGGTLCLVADYADGGHAAGRVEKARCAAGDGLTERQVLKWFSQALLALTFLHERQVVHRDLRTRRLLLTARDDVVVSGAALSTLLARSFAPERPDIEAVRYLSPELVEGKEHTLSSDMWALGAVLYELVSLWPPYDHAHPRGLAERILAGPPRPLPSSSSEGLQKLCMSLLQREPAKRPSATQALREPMVQSRLLSLFNEEPAFTPGWGGALRPPVNTLDGGALLPRHSAQASVASPRKGGFGPLLLTGPAPTPRGLRRVGEGILSGAGLQAGPRAASLLHMREAREAQKALDIKLALEQQRKETKSSAELLQEEGGISATNSERVRSPRSVGNVAATVLKDLNFTSACFLEGLATGPWSSENDADVQPRLGSSGSTSSNRWDLPPPQHQRDFPRFS